MCTWYANQRVIILAHDNNYKYIITIIICNSMLLLIDNAFLSNLTFVIICEN